MADIEIITQLIESMDEAVLSLERAVESKNAYEIQKLKTFIFDLHIKIDHALRGQNV